MGISIARSIVFIALVLSSSLSLAAPQRTIVIFGDSLSAGYGLSQNTGWVDLLQRRLQEKKWGYRVINASVSGETTAGGRVRLESTLKQYKPNLMVLELGGNDGLRGLSLASVRGNLDAMIRICVASKVQVLLVGIRLPTNYGKSYTEKFHAMYGELARRHRVPLLASLMTGFETKRELFQPDGIHPARAAQTMMLENVWRELEPLLTAR
jgi:acyl-CoA thioesterase I